MPFPRHIAVNLVIQSDAGQGLFRRGLGRRRLPRRSGSQRQPGQSRHSRRRPARFGGQGELPSRHQRRHPMLENARQ